jgi:segregation and condensation protein B
MENDQLKNIIEAALLAADQPLSTTQLSALFPVEEAPPQQDIRQALNELTEDCHGRGVELVQVASGFRLQVRQELQPWVARLWQERPPRYSRALLETLVLIAYRQPVTRGEIEQIRGVSVSTNIVRTLQEREWVRIIGHRDVPGRPALFGTTRKFLDYFNLKSQFLDYFNLKSLDDLPTLAEIKDIEGLEPELVFDTDGAEKSKENGSEIEAQGENENENEQQETETVAETGDDDAQAQQQDHD